MSTIAPQVSMTGRLFQTSAMLVPIAVSASTRSSSSIGIEKALMAKEKAANRAPTAVPTISSAQPVGVVNSIAAMCMQAGKRQQAEEQGVDDDGGPHPEQHEQAQQNAGKQDLSSRSRSDDDHAGEAERLAGRDPPALLVKADGEDRSDDHKAGKSGKEDVVPAESEQAGDDHGGHDENAKTVDEARRGLHK